MEKQYRDQIEKIYLTEESKKRLIQKLADQQKTTSSSFRVRHFPLRVAIAICLLIISTTTIAIGLPVLHKNFRGNGYEQSATILGKSIMRDSWTLTLTDCVGDDRYLYLGLELAAPKGTVLGEEEYRLEEYDVSFGDLEDYVMAWHLSQVPDEDQADNRIHFILWIEGGYHENTFNGKEISLTFSNLYHIGEWDEVLSAREHLYDCKAEWHFNNLKMTYPDHAIRLNTNVKVSVLDVEANVTKVEVSPIGVSIIIEGDELKGHHEWVVKDAPDGWYSCIEQPEIILYNKEGKALEPDAEAAPFGVRAGSGCQGGERHNDEEGRLKIIQSYGYLLDMNNISYVEINGVRISLE